MSQSDFGTIDPATKTGSQLAIDLNNDRDAMQSTHKGSSAPSYLKTGMLWLDDAANPTWYLKIYDGTDWLSLFEVDSSSNEATAYLGGSLPSGALGTAAFQDIGTSSGDVLGIDDAGALALLDTVGSSQIADGAVTAVKIAAGGVGATALATSSVATAKIQDNAVTLDKFAHGTADTLLGFSAAGAPSEITAGSNITISSGVLSASAGLEDVSQGDLNTSSGSVATGSFSAGVNDVLLNKYFGSLNYGPASYINLEGNQLTLPGGEYGFYPRIQASGNQTLLTAYQRYVTSSPPFDMGDGEAGGFVFVLVNNSTGEAVSTYSADTPPWGYNGPTDIRGKVCPKTGKKMQKVLERLTLEQILDGVKPKYVEREVTQEIKNADMGLIPHPFGVVPEGHTVVLLDPLSDRLATLIKAQNEYVDFDVSNMVLEGNIVLDNEALDLKGPKGVMQVRFKKR